MFSNTNDDFEFTGDDINLDGDNTPLDDFSHFETDDFANIEVDNELLQQLLQTYSELPELPSHICELLAAIKDMKINQAEKICAEHPEFINYFDWKTMSAFFTEAHTKEFLRIALRRKIYPLIDRLFVSEKFISGSDEEQARDIKTVLLSRYNNVIKKLISLSRITDEKRESLLEWYINRCATDEDKAKGIKNILSSICSDAIKQIVSLSIQVADNQSQDALTWYINRCVTEVDKAKAIKDILSSRCSDAVKQITYLFIHVADNQSQDALTWYINRCVTEADKAKAIKDILSSHGSDAIKKIVTLPIQVGDNQSQDALTWYINRCVTEVDKAKAIKDILSSQCLDAIKKLVTLPIQVTDDQSQNVLTWYINRCATDEDKAKAIKDILITQCSAAIKQLISISIQIEGGSQNCIEWYINSCSTDDEKVKVLTDILVCRCYEVIDLLTKKTSENSQSLAEWYLLSAADEETKIKRLSCIKNAYIYKEEKLKLLSQYPDLVDKIKFKKTEKKLEQELKERLKGNTSVVTNDNANSTVKHRTYQFRAKLNLDFLPHPNNLAGQWIFSEEQAKKVKKVKETHGVKCSKIRGCPFYQARFDRDQYTAWYSKQGANHGLDPSLSGQTHTQTPSVVRAINQLDEEQQALSSVEGPSASITGDEQATLTNNATPSTQNELVEPFDRMEFDIASVLTPVETPAAPTQLSFWSPDISTNLALFSPINPSLTQEVVIDNIHKHNKVV